MANELTDYEQKVETTNQFAQLVRVYYDALCHQGFSMDDALLLTIEYQRSILNKSFSNNKGNNNGK